MNKLLISSIILVVVVFTSCQRDPMVVRFSQETEEWIPENFYDDIVLASDDDTLVFKFKELNETPTNIYKKNRKVVIGTRDRFYIEFESDSSEFDSLAKFNFQLSIEANPNENGDYLWSYLKNKSSFTGFSTFFPDKKAFAYDFGNNITGYYAGDDGQSARVIDSYIKILDSTTINNQTFSNEVMHFVFRELQDKWGYGTVTDIYIAKGWGLVGFELYNGKEYKRIFL